MTVDNWGLKKLFHFDDKHWKVTNDTDKVVIIKSRDGQDIPVNPSDTVHIGVDNYSIVLPNNNTIRYSDKQNLKAEDFWENFNVIIAHLMKRLKDGHVIDGLDFLDYHYKWTKNKSRFLTFVKHYILTVSWVPTEQKDRSSMFIDAIRDWVEEKKKGRKKPIYIILLSIPIIVYTIGLIWSTEYKEIFIGALIGGIAAPLKEVYDLMTD